MDLLSGKGFLVKYGEALQKGCSGIENGGRILLGESQGIKW